MKVLLIVNPSASSVTARTRIVIQKALSADHRLEVAATTRRGHATRLAQSAANDGMDVVVVLGGVVIMDVVVIMNGVVNMAVVVPMGAPMAIGAAFGAEGGGDLSRGGTDLANGRHPVKMAEPVPDPDAPEEIVYLILG